MSKLEKVKEYFEHYSVIRFIILGVLALLLFLGYFMGQYFSEKDEEAPSSELIEELMAEKSSDTQEDSVVDFIEQEGGETPQPQIMMVDIKGEVQLPGVYQVEATNRIIDVIEKAGGLTQEAETKDVNFAQLISDQMVIYIPKIGEEIEQTDNHLIVDPENANAESAQVNINSADKNGLMTLTGIGPAKADSIIAYREEYGSFQSIDELKNVSGIGEATFNNLKDFITVQP